MLLNSAPKQQPWLLLSQNTASGGTASYIVIWIYQINDGRNLDLSIRWMSYSV